MNIVEQFNSNGVLFPTDTVDLELVDQIKQLSHQFKNNSKFNPHLSFANDDSNPFLKLVKDDTILQYVRQILGDDLVMWNCHLYSKPSQQTTQVMWHQDSYYFPLYPKVCLTVWVALDTVNHDNGAMYYIPNKLNADLDHRSDNDKLSFKYYIDETSIDSSEQIINQRNCGQFSIHDFYTVHRSTSNTSNDYRSAMIIRYAPSYVHYDEIEHQQRLYDEFDKCNDGTMNKNQCIINTGSVIVSGRNLNEQNKLWK